MSDSTPVPEDAMTDGSGDAMDSFCPECGSAAGVPCADYDGLSMGRFHEDRPVPQTKENEDD